MVPYLLNFSYWRLESQIDDDELSSNNNNLNNKLDWAQPGDNNNFQIDSQLPENTSESKNAFSNNEPEAEEDDHYDQIANQRKVFYVLAQLYADFFSQVKTVEAAKPMRNMIVILTNIRAMKRKKRKNTPIANIGTKSRRTAGKSYMIE